MARIVPELDASAASYDPIGEHPRRQGENDRQDCPGGLQPVRDGGLEPRRRGRGLYPDYDDRGHGSEDVAGASASPASASTSKNSLSRRAVNPQMTEPPHIQASVG